MDAYCIRLASIINIMATLTLKSVPDELYAQLKARAERHRRSLNREAITCLEQAVRASADRDPQSVLAALRAARLRLRGIHVTDKQLAAARHEGRR